MNIIYWLRSTGPDGNDVVPMYDYGPCRTHEDGRVFFDRHVRPVSVSGEGFTCTVGGNDIYHDPECTVPIK